MKMLPLFRCDRLSAAIGNTLQVVQPQSRSAR
jgi:hypothetical protein